MTEDQIKYMVRRFLGWKLPKHFNPDGGISFKRMFNADCGPTGTNLFDFDQACGMVGYMVDGLVPDESLITGRAQLERHRIANHLETTANKMLRDEKSDAIDGYCAAVILDLARVIRAG